MENQIVYFCFLSPRKSLPFPLFRSLERGFLSRSYHEFSCAGTGIQLSAVSVSLLPIWLGRFLLAFQPNPQLLASHLGADLWDFQGLNWKGIWLQFWLVWCLLQRQLQKSSGTWEAQGARRALSAFQLYPDCCWLSRIPLGVNCCSERIFLCLGLSQIPGFHGISHCG